MIGSNDVPVICHECVGTLVERCAKEGVGIHDGSNNTT